MFCRNLSEIECYMKYLIGQAAMLRTYVQKCDVARPKRYGVLVQAEKRTLNKTKKINSAKTTPAKKTRRNSSSSMSSEEEFCTICLKQMPKKLNRNNSVNCNMCNRPVHFKCANMTASYYTCVHCDSDYSDNE